MLGSLAALALPSCASDRILDVPAVCGDGILEVGEGCDVTSPGCNACQQASGWSCDEQGCVTVCGDGIVSGDEQCDPPNGTSCDTACKTAGYKAEECDMTGWWIARQTAFSAPDGLTGVDGGGVVQTSSNWFVFRFEQTGDAVVTKQSLFCGIRVTGTVDVDLTSESLAGTATEPGLVYRNPQHKQDAVLGGRERRGTFKKNGDHCELDLERHWYLRGAKAALLPADFGVDVGDPSLPKLPIVAPGKTALDPADATTIVDIGETVDIDGNGFPGISYDISKLGHAMRDTVQRDWQAYVFRPAHPIALHASEFVTAAEFRNEENILHVSECVGGTCGVFALNSHAIEGADHRAIFRFVGASLDDARAKAVFAGDPAAGVLADDLVTCQRVRDALPHDKATE